MSQPDTITADDQRLAESLGHRHGAAGRPARQSVSVVLPCLNEEAGVGGAVAAAWRGLAAAGVDEGSGEVLVVDNGSTDAGPARAIAAGARLVREPRRGYGAAIAAPYPRRGSRTSRAPAAIARAGPASVEPLSTTRTSPDPSSTPAAANPRQAAATAPPTPASSFRHGRTTLTDCLAGLPAAPWRWPSDSASR